jgi:hypothetical protein
LTAAALAPRSRLHRAGEVLVLWMLRAVFLVLACALLVFAWAGCRAVLELAQGR